jgi:peptidoglycan/xylan/chitin deacetylase (PgdA/CDA1 family)
MRRWRVLVPGELIPRIADQRVLAQLAQSRRQGELSLQVARSDPTRLHELGVGSWFRARWQRRLARRVLVGFPRPALALLARLGPRWLDVALDASFWAGVRRVASRREWRRLTVSSYVVFLYHRIALDRECGEERLYVPPAHFRWQLLLLKACRFHPLQPEELLAFHRDPGRLLPRRSYVLSADDGFLDTVDALAWAGELRPQLFVPTALVGAEAPWRTGGVLATWEDLRRAAGRGVVIGSHGRRHIPMSELDRALLEDELAGSRVDLQAHLGQELPLLAYPHGSHDEQVRRGAAAAGFLVAYTSEAGRNGAGTDPFCLRRISIKAWDSPLSFLWKALTGEHLPRWWERWRLRRYRSRRRW